MKRLIYPILLIIICPLLVRADFLSSQVTNPKISVNQDKITLYWENPEDVSFLKTIVYGSPIPMESYFSYEAIDAFYEKVYEGKDEEITITNTDPNLPYYFAIFTMDKSGKYSEPMTIAKKANLEENKNSNDNNSNSNKVIVEEKYTKSLVGASATIVNQVSKNEAEIVYNYNQDLNLDPENENRRLSLFIIIKSPHELEKQDMNAISYFIDQGTPTTILLGSGERAGVLNSYLSAFNKLPRNELEWQDIIKIANGRWPDEKNIDVEEKAATDTFSAIYQREANMENPNDNAAVTVIAYGLRPASRNMESEKNAIKIYQSIFDKYPSEAYEWDMVRAIAYSGATR